MKERKSNLLEQIRGDSVVWHFHRTDKRGVIIADVPDKIYFTVKWSPEDEDYLFQKTKDDIAFDTNTYEYSIQIAPEDTNKLEYGDYVYDIEVIKNGEKRTIARGTYRITWESTWQSNEGKEN